MAVSPMLRATAVRQLSDTISDTNNNDDVKSYLSHPFATLGCAVAVCLVPILLSWFYAWLRRRCGLTSHGGAELDMRSREGQDERQRFLEDERVAVRMEQTMEDERKLEAIKQRRNERRRKYEQFLAPYTLTVTESDLYTASKGKTTIGSESGSTCSCASKNGDDEDITLHHDSDSSDDDEDATGHDKVIETHPSHAEPVPLLLCMSTSSLSNAPQEQLLRHPFKKSDNTLADVEASCTVCLLDYEEGDRVVFSTRTICPHAFHEDCIMMWLEKGKKRCPICRNFFVPGGHMDKKATIQHAEDDEYAIRNIKNPSQGNMDDDPTGMKKCLHHEETNADTTPGDRSHLGTILSTATSASMYSSELEQAQPSHNYNMIYTDST